MNTTVNPPLFAVLSQLSTQLGTLTPQMQQALNELNYAASRTGGQLYALNQLEEAEHFLNIVAASGDPWAQFTMATIHAHHDGIWFNEQGEMTSNASEETIKWLRLSAAQDYVPALIQLGDTQSLEKAKTLINGLPDNDKPMGMYFMYLATDVVSWLESSAAAGYNLAQFKLARLYLRKPQIIANEALRAARIEELYQESADGGLPLAVYTRIFAGNSTASITEKQTRLSQLAWMGQVDGMLEYGYALANRPRNETRTAEVYPDEHAPSRTYGLARDLGVAYAMLKYVMKKTVGIIKAPALAYDVHSIEMQMTSKDGEKADATLSQLTEKDIQPFYRLEQLIIPGTAK